MAAAPFEKTEVGIVLNGIEEHLGRRQQEPARETRDQPQLKIAWTTPGLPTQFRLNVLGNGVTPETKRPKGAHN